MTTICVWTRLGALGALLAASACSPARPVAEPAASGAPTAPAPSDEQRCDGGELSACAALGDSLHDSPGDGDRARAAAYYLRACDGGSAYACARGASLVQATDVTRAAAMMKTACDAGFDPSCNDLAYAAERGIGVPVDPALALSLYVKICARGAPYGCFNQGIFSETGRGGAKADDAEAARLYGVACEMRYDHACAAYGRMLVQGRGVPEDRERGRRLLETSCASGYAYACEFLTKHASPERAP